VVTRARQSTTQAHPLVKSPPALPTCERTSSRADPRQH
jgi:hypothetical protein